MVLHYFRTAFRSLWRSRQFTLINILGLTLGIVVFLFIMEYVSFEWNANRFNKNYSEIYRVNVKYKEGNTDYILPPGYAPILKQRFPAIINATRIATDIGGGVITYSAGNKVFREDNIKYVDGNFLSVFSFPIVSGSLALLQSKTLALSDHMSRKLFGNENAIGKAVTVSNQFGNTLYTVKAVYKVPDESDIKAEVLLSLETLATPANRDDNDWADPAGIDNGFTSIYLQLRSDVNTHSLAGSMTQFVRSTNPGSKSDEVYLQPMDEVHLAPSFDYPFQTNGNLLLVVVFACIALLIVLIAWLNYINLSTAQGINRAKEVSVRKILGASRSRLAFQHLIETLLLTLFSTITAILLVTLVQPTFNSFAGKEFSLAVLNNGWFWLAGAAIILVGSFLSGSYVALVITSFQPLDTIRSKGEIRIKGLSVRKALVVFQFTASIVFIISTVILYKQLQFMKTGSLGMNLNQLLVIQGPTVSSEWQVAKNVSFKNSLAQLLFVNKITASNNVPGIGYNFSANGITGVSASEADKKKSYQMFICDQNFFDTYNISFAQGATFSTEAAERSWNNVKNVIINEKAAKQLGYDTKENLIGKIVNWGDPYRIIGVVKDYHHMGLREPIKPTIYLGSVSFGFFTIQTNTQDMQSKIASIQELYKKTFPGNPFDYFFADEKYDQQYAEEQQLGKVFIASACVAIFIACLGLFGLAAFSARQRVKEIGIRKVLGASVAGITTLLSKDFLLLVVIAFLIASPIAFLSMNKWLQNFAYRVDISWWMFVLSGVTAVLVALFTISFQAMKAALANPVKSLRSE